MANQVLYGFRDLQTLKNQALTPEIYPVVSTAIRESVAAYQAEIQQMVSLFAERTTESQEIFKTVQGARLQPMDEHGRARPVMTTGSYQVAYPIRQAGIADGETFVVRAMQTVGDIEQTTATMMIADSTWLRDQLLAALFANASYVERDPKIGNLTIQGLANGDTTTYYTASAGTGVTATHYFAQAAAIADATNPYTQIGTNLRKYTANGGDIIVFIAPGLSLTTQNLATFYDGPDANLAQGIGATRLTGRGPNVAYPGTLLGYESSGRVWVVEWDKLPAGYYVAVTTGGDRPLKQREYPQPQLQGFSLVAERNDYPHFERQYARWTGFGGFNRVGAAVGLVGNASYSVPTGYAEPLP